MIIYDEKFLVDGKPDPKIWTYQVGTKWANNESQCYVEDINQAYVSNQSLKIKATLNDSDECRYVSARLSSKGKLEFMYGKLTIRAKMPKGRGAWPALWLMGNTSSNQVGWPLCGEIDLVEFAGNRPGIVTSAIHTKSFNHTINTDKGAKIELSDASDAFHDYELDWTKDYLKFSCDGKEYFRVTKEANDTVNEWPFDHPYYLIMNLAVGGWYGGEIHDEDLPYVMEIKSIKIEQK